MHWIEEIALKRRCQRSTVFLVETTDEDRIKEFLSKCRSRAVDRIFLSKKLRYGEIIQYNIVKGDLLRLEEKNDKVIWTPVDLEDISPLEYIDRNVRKWATLAVIHYIYSEDLARTILPAVLDWSMNPDENIYERHSTIIIFTSDIEFFPEKIRKFCYTLTIPYSTEEERYRLISNIVNEIINTYAMDKGETKLVRELRKRLKPTREIILASAGLDLHLTESATYESILMERALKPEYYTKYKVEILRQHGIEYIEPKYGFEAVGGYELLKQYIRERIIDLIRNPGEAEKYGLTPPKGIIMFGLPGVGKTHLATALAKEIKLAVLKIDASTFLRGIVGATEKRIKQVRNLVENFAPCILFIDEIDQLTMARGRMMATDSGVSRRLTNMLLDWFGDRDRRSIIIGASVTGDTPILIKDSSGIKLVDIGEFVDRFFDSNEEGRKYINGVEVLSMKNGRVCFQPIQYVFRHKVKKSNILKIDYVGGWIKVTDDHSLFTLTEDGKIMLKKAGDLRVGDYLITFRPKAISFKRKTNIDGKTITPSLVRLIGRYLAEGHAQIHIRKKPYIKKMVYITAEEGEKLKNRRKELGLSLRKLAEESGVGYGTVFRLEKGGVNVHYDLLQKILFTLGIDINKKQELGIENRITRSLHFCLGTHEKDVIKDTIETMERIFNKSPRIHRPYPSETILVYCGKDLVNFFAKNFGKDTYTKHLDMELPYPEQLISGYSGDACVKRKDVLEFTTVSKRLAQEFAWYCRLNGYPSFVRQTKVKEREIHGRKIKPTNAYKIEVYINPKKYEKSTTLSRIPTGILKKIKQNLHKTKILSELNKLIYNKTVYYERLREIIGELSRIEVITNLIEQLKWLYESDISIVKITRIRREDCDKEEYVYDISVPKSESFFAGITPVLCHNTNFISDIDPAFLRPGRTDALIPVLLPDRDARAEIFRIHMSVLRKVPLAGDIDFNRLAEESELMTGAEIEQIVIEASFKAKKEGSRVGMEHLLDAIHDMNFNREERMSQFKRFIEDAKKLTFINRRFLQNLIEDYVRKEGGKAKAFASYL